MIQVLEEEMLEGPAERMVRNRKVNDVRSQSGTEAHPYYSSLHFPGSNVVAIIKLMIATTYIVQLLSWISYLMKITVNGGAFTMRPRAGFLPFPSSDHGST